MKKSTKKSRYVCICKGFFVEHNNSYTLSLPLHFTGITIEYNRPLAHDVKTVNLEYNFKVPTFNRAKNEWQL